MEGLRLGDGGLDMIKITGVHPLVYIVTIATQICAIMPTYGVPWNDGSTLTMD
jgi:hypothetical protein